MPRYLNLSELAYVRHRAVELINRRRPRKAGRVRAYAASPGTLSDGRPPRSPRPPLIPVSRRPLEALPPEVLRAVFVGLSRLEVAV